MMNRTICFCAMLLGLLALAGAEPAQAADWRFGLRIGAAQPVLVRPAVTVTRRWVPERFETRTEEVLIAPASYERRWVPPTRETYVDGYGLVRSVVRPGYWTAVYVPARYETRCVTVRIPGYWEEIPVSTRGYEREYLAYGAAPAFSGYIATDHRR